MAARLRAEVDAGRPQRDVVLLVRATSSLRLYEQALEEQGLSTYVVGGRGYWAQEQVRDGVAYLALLVEPARRGVALRGAVVAVLRRGRRRAGPALRGRARPRATAPGPRCAARSPDSSSWLAALDPDEAARLVGFARFAAGERLRAERLPVEVLLERAIAATGYDLAILGRSGGDRRLANLRKLMRLAREYERAEGRDLRGFLDYAVAQDLAEAREGEAALESEGLDAVRLMTIHRAKGLEFPVVCVADLGRPAAAGRERLLVGDDGDAPRLKLATLAGGDAVPALGYDRIAAALAEAEAAEERRLLYVAATRAEERLILSGGIDTGKWPAPRGAAPPIDWLAPRARGDRRRCRRTRRSSAAATARSACRLVTAANLAPEAAAPAPRDRTPAPGTALPAEPKVIPVAARPQPAQRRLSYSSLQDYARCGYRFYLTRVLGLSRVTPPGEPHEPDEPARDGRARPARGPDPRLARPPAARAGRLRPPGAARRGGRDRARRRARDRAGARARRGHPGAGRRVRRLAAVRPARRRARRAARGRVRVRAGARRRRAAAHRVRRRARARGRRRRAGRRLQDRPARRGRRAGGARGPLLRDPADGLRPGRAAGRRRARRGRLRAARAPGAAGRRHVHAGRRARARRRAARPGGGRAGRALAGRARARTASCAASAPAARRCARGRRRRRCARPPRSTRRTRPAPWPAAAGRRSRTAARASGGRRSPR